MRYLKFVRPDKANPCLFPTTYDGLSERSDKKEMTLLLSIRNLGVFHGFRIDQCGRVLEPIPVERKENVLSYINTT
jgi:hypothetical protein